jgi:N-dimethylarginine dimethylaminohydrolase
MYVPIIYLGDRYIYNEEACFGNGDKLKLKEALRMIKMEIEKKGVKVIRPLRTRKDDMCMSLWVRDSSFTLHNKVYLMPNMVSDGYRSKQISSEVDVIPYKDEGEIVPSGVNLDGGDIIIDGRRILLGKGRRSDESGLEYMKDKFVDRDIVSVRHHALHLDCCLCVLPGNKLFYSKRYIKRLPSVLRESYLCYNVEDYMNENDDPNLATNMLLIGNTIIVAKKRKFERFYNHIESLGFEVIRIPFKNIFKGGGGVRCMTQWYKMPKDQEIF